MPTARKILDLGQLIAARGAAHILLLEAAELQKRWGEFKYLANVDKFLLIAQATKYGCEVGSFADWADGEYGGIRKIYADRLIQFALVRANKLKAAYSRMAAIPELGQVGVSAELVQKVKTARFLRDCHITMMELLEEAAGLLAEDEFALSAQHTELALCVHMVSLQIEAGILLELKLSESLLLEFVKQVEPIRAELLAIIFNQARDARLGLKRGLPPAA